MALRYTSLGMRLFGGNGWLLPRVLRASKAQVGSAMNGRLVQPFSTMQQPLALGGTSLGQDKTPHIKSEQQDQKQPKTQIRDKGAVPVDASSAPTRTVRLYNLPPGTTQVDIQYAIATKKFAASIKSIAFEYDSNLRPIRSCRATFYKKEDAVEFLVHANNSVYVGYTIGAEFVHREIILNAARRQYLGSASGRLVLLYGYPMYVHQHRIRDRYRDYLLVDTNIPAVQPAPQGGQTFLSRRGAFILQFITPSEARRFVRDVHMSTFNPAKGQKSADGDQAEAQSRGGNGSWRQGQDPESDNTEYCIKALLLN
ncbi:hypothetical protein LPJ56_001385 [Coemansia sp. RSA 2599]|nr:hypothetical protein LPJ56_001385 [Coemansia sp. RSA 2599]